MRRSVRLEASADGRTLLLVDIDSRRPGIQREVAWRKALEERALSGATVRRKLAALSSLFEYLYEQNAVDFNPVKGAKSPKVDSHEGRTPALGDPQARALLAAPDPARLKRSCDAGSITGCTGKNCAA